MNERYETALVKLKKTLCQTVILSVFLEIKDSVQSMHLTKAQLVEWCHLMESALQEVERIPCDQPNSNAEEKVSGNQLS